MNLRYTIFLYLILILFIFIWKPQLIILNVDNKKRKVLYLIFLIIILAIISFYIKVLTEWFF
jgi:uncharacterized membrane protein